MKKLFSVTLAFILILTTMSVTPYALDFNATKINIESVEASAGETVEIGLELQNNPGIVSANFNVAFDEGLTLIGATKGDVFPADMSYIPPKQLSSVGKITSSCNFAWSGTDIADKDIKDGTFLKLKFEVSKQAKVGDTYDVTVSSRKSDVVDKNLNSLDIQPSIATITVVEKKAAENATKITFDSVKVLPGKTFEVKLNLENNTGIVSANINVAFDDKLTLVGAVNGDVFPSSMSFIPPKQLSTTGEIKTSCNFAWQGADISDDEIKDGTIITLKFRASSDAKLGEKCNITISARHSDVVDKNMNIIELDAFSGLVEFAKTEVQYNALEDFLYEITDDGLVITGYNGEKTDVAIAPSYIVDGVEYDVVGISESSFEGNETIKSLVIPAIVKSIGDYAFYDCTNLVEVTVFGKNTVIGEKSLGYYYISRKLDGITAGFTINGYNGSTAQEYADLEDEITFIPLSEECNHVGGTATCSEKAICDNCKEPYGELNPSNHKTIVTDKAVAATCKNTGLTEGSHCEACQAVIKAQEVTPKLNHTPVSANNARPATCKEAGKEADTVCEVCQEVLEVGKEIPKLNHVGGTATCSEKAICDNCKEPYGELNPSNHKTIVTDKAVAATCKNTGLTEGSHCEACQAVIKAQEVTPKLNHTPVSANNARPATCKEAGKEADTVCEVCREVLEVGKEIPKTAHTPVSANNAKPATCKEAGKEADTVCEVCQEVLEVGKEIPKLNHSFNEWVVTDEATCSTDGCMERSCSACGETEKTVISATGFVDKNNDGYCDECEKSYADHAKFDGNINLSKVNEILRLVLKLLETVFTILSERLEDVNAFDALLEAVRIMQNIIG